MSIDRFVPVPRLIEQHHVDVRAPAERAHGLLRRLDLRHSGAVRAVLALQGLPLRLRGQAPQRAQRLTLDDLVQRFQLRVLVDEPTRFVAGAHASPRTRDLALGLEIRGNPLGERATRLTAEIRVSCDDDVAWRRFERAYRVLGPVARVVLRHVLERLVNDLGAPSVDQVRVLAQST
jgi:hypothetical protein